MPSINVEKYLLPATNVGANIESSVQKSNDLRKYCRAAISSALMPLIYFTEMGGTPKTYFQLLLMHVIIF